jgi:hypothetical protein
MPEIQGDILKKNATKTVSLNATEHGTVVRYGGLPSPTHTHADSSGIC